MVFQNILVVCIGNICRSPMAQVVLAKALPGTTVSSAGVQAMTGWPADELACELMSERGLDLSRHIARDLSREMCQQADLILVMDDEQRRVIERRHPFVTGKVYRLCDATGRDVPDPYREGRDAFEEALELIDEGAASWVNRISRVGSR